MLNHYSFRDLEKLDPKTLKTSLQRLIDEYQRNRSNIIAWMISLYGEALSKHPDYDDEQVDRCNYERFSHQWRWLAHQTPQPQPALIPVGQSNLSARRQAKLDEKGLYL